MAEPALTRTASLSPAELGAVRALLVEAFDGDFDDEDYEHALGGMHALVLDGSTLVAHGSVVLRELLHGPRALRTGYVEAVAVRADRRGEGHGAAVMAALEQVIRQAYELGALASTEEALGFYAARRWQRWTGTASVLTRDGVRRTEDADGAIFVLAVSARLSVPGDLACDWRNGDVW